MRNPNNIFLTRVGREVVAAVSFISLLGCVAIVLENPNLFGSNLQGEGTDLIMKC